MRWLSVTFLPLLLLPFVHHQKFFPLSPPPEMALAVAAAALSLLSVPVSNDGGGAFCLPSAGAFSYRVGILTTQELIPGTCGFAYSGLRYTDRARGLSRTDVVFADAERAASNSIRYTDDKKGAAWTVVYYTGKPTCTKSAWTPLPPGSECYATDVTPARKGTQGGLATQWWTTTFAKPPTNESFVTVCNPLCDTSFPSLLRAFYAIRLNETVFDSYEFEDFTTAAVSGHCDTVACAHHRSLTRALPPPPITPQIPASVFTLPAECPL